MRNTYKYTRPYSGTEPQFVEGDIFRTIIPLGEAATATMGPTSVSATTEVKLEKEKLAALLNYCTTARSRKEMQELCGIKTAEYF